MLNYFIGNKCCLCGEKDKNLNKIGGYGMYDNNSKYYHEECLQEIACDPEHYKHIQVDRAIDILDKLKEKRRKAIQRKEQFKEQCETIKKHCIE